METLRRPAALAALFGAALSLFACASPRPATIPTAPAAVAQAGLALATAAAPQTPAEAIEGALPAESPAAPEPAVPPATPLPDRSLLGVRPGEPLRLLDEIPIARTDFGVRVAFSPDSAVLLHNGNGLSISRFDLRLGEPAGVLTGIQDFSPFTISISPDGSAVVADDGTQLRVWMDGANEPILALPMPPVSAVLAAGFHSDDLFYAADLRGNVMVWNPQAWGEISGFRYPGAIDAAVLFPDGRAIALHDRAKQEIGIFDLQGTRLGNVRTTNPDDQLLSISPSGDRFLLHVDYGYPSEGVRIVAVGNGESRLDLPMLNFRHFAVAADWSLLAAVGVQNELRLYDLPSGELRLSQPLEVARTLGLTLSPDGSYLALYVFRADGQGPAIQVWGRGLGGP